MSTHFIQVCQYGYTHGQCRCASKDKDVRLITCNQDAHRKNPKIESRTPEDDLHVLMEAINEIARAVGKSTLGNLNSVDAYLLLAHEVAEIAKSNADDARSALYDNGRMGSSRGYSC